MKKIRERNKSIYIIVSSTLLYIQISFCLLVLSCSSCTVFPHFCGHVCHVCSINVLDESSSQHFCLFSSLLSSAVGKRRGCFSFYEKKCSTCTLTIRCVSTAAGTVIHAQLEIIQSRDGHYGRSTFFLHWQSCCRHKV